ncbi:hypothetical protein CALVIDRAFT_567299 [Calocera viscosa TUFC12733]|uniref:Uncharacterized protein n=1 Tax=Calocera viscosa (strain TUFC12733) TaxID=1330018 RepID=A0A167I9K3_CALVF|nr:hypothetical protein CALVIDRAFT_567299 [Calocera viscosa TUFC12733]
MAQQSKIMKEPEPAPNKLDTTMWSQTDGESWSRTMALQKSLLHSTIAIKIYEDQNPEWYQDQFREVEDKSVRNLLEDFKDKPAKLESPMIIAVHPDNVTNWDDIKDNNPSLSPEHFSKMADIKDITKVVVIQGHHRWVTQIAWVKKMGYKGEKALQHLFWFAQIYPMELVTDPANAMLLEHLSTNNARTQVPPGMDIRWRVACSHMKKPGNLQNKEDLASRELSESMLRAFQDIPYREALNNMFSLPFFKKVTNEGVITAHSNQAMHDVALLLLTRTYEFFTHPSTWQIIEHDQEVSCKELNGPVFHKVLTESWRAFNSMRITKGKGNYDYRGKHTKDSSYGDFLIEGILEAFKRPVSTRKKENEDTPKFPPKLYTAAPLWVEQVLKPWLEKHPNMVFTTTEIHTLELNRWARHQAVYEIAGALIHPLLLFHGTNSSKRANTGRVKSWLWCLMHKLLATPVPREEWDEDLSNLEDFPATLAEQLDKMEDLLELLNPNKMADVLDELHDSLNVCLHNAKIPLTLSTRTLNQLKPLMPAVNEINNYFTSWLKQEERTLPPASDMDQYLLNLQQAILTQPNPTKLKVPSGMREITTDILKQAHILGMFDEELFKNKEWFALATVFKEEGLYPFTLLHQPVLEREEDKLWVAGPKFSQVTSQTKAITRDTTPGPNQTDLDGLTKEFHKQRKEAENLFKQGLKTVVERLPQGSSSTWVEQVEESTHAELVRVFKAEQKEKKLLSQEKIQAEKAERIRQKEAKKIADAASKQALEEALRTPTEVYQQGYPRRLPPVPLQALPAILQGSAPKASTSQTLANLDLDLTPPSSQEIRETQREEPESEDEEKSEKASDSEQENQAGELEEGEEEERPG